MDQEERQDIIESILEEAEHYVDEFHHLPYICRGMTDSRLMDHDSDGEIDYDWSCIQRIIKLYDGKGGRCLDFITDDGRHENNVFIDFTIFNKVAKQMLEEMLTDIDPDNPLEAGFVPVSNYR